MLLPLNKHKVVLCFIYIIVYFMDNFVFIVSLNNNHQHKSVVVIVYLTIKTYKKVLLFHCSVVVLI